MATLKMEYNSDVPSSNSHHSWLAYNLCEQMSLEFANIVGALYTCTVYLHVAF